MSRQRLDHLKSVEFKQTADGHDDACLSRVEPFYRRVIKDGDGTGVIDMEGSVAKAIRYQQRFFVLRALPDEAVLENPRLSQAWVDHREERDTD